MKTRFVFFYAFALLPLLVLTSFVACKKDNLTTVAFEATYTTINELLNPPPPFKLDGPCTYYADTTIMPLRLSATVRLIIW